eukprot:gene18840-24625_t
MVISLITLVVKLVGVKDYTSQ